MPDWPSLLSDPDSTTPIPGDNESIAAIRCRIDGHDAVLVWCRFDLSAGTLSVAAGRRFVDALAYARAERLPVVAIANSGGARMQEGNRAFVQMVGCIGAVHDLIGDGLAFLVYLADPTMGGVFASWGSLGQVTFAQPGATIGFTGPRIAEGLGTPIEPASSQTAEGLYANGLVDDLVEPSALRGRLAEVLNVLAPATVGSTAPTCPAPVAQGPTGWAAVSSSRSPERTCVLDELLAACDGAVRLRGDRCGGVDPAVQAVLTRLDGQPTMVIGHRRIDGVPGKPTVAGLRLATRAARIAEQSGATVITVIDSAGAVIGGDQEAGGFAGEIARSVDTLSGLQVPVIVVLAGQGSGGAALAWVVGDRVLAAADSWMSPISPEAGSLILRRSTDGAAEMADLQRVSATELRSDGLVDELHEVEDLVDAARAALGTLAGLPPDLPARRARFGGFSS